MNKEFLQMKVKANKNKNGGASARVSQNDSMGRLSSQMPSVNFSAKTMSNRNLYNSEIDSGDNDSNNVKDSEISSRNSDKDSNNNSFNAP